MRGPGHRARAHIAPRAAAAQTSGMRLLTRWLGALAAALFSAPMGAQDTPPGGPKVGDPAPDFTLQAATKAGVNPAPVTLSDLRGQTVVLAFFPKARTGG
jgi:hypothetical protein